MHNEHIEELFFSYTCVPALGEGGHVGVFYVDFNDVMRSVLAARRASTLRAAADATANGIDPEMFWRKLVDTVSSDDNGILSVFACSI